MAVELGEKLREALEKISPIRAPGLKKSFLDALKDVIRDVKLPSSPRASRLPSGKMQITDPKSGDIYTEE